MPRINNSNILAFYHEYDEDGYLSNWYASTFTYLGIEFCCTEQAMMWTKARVFGAYDTADRILRIADQGTIKRLGRNGVPRYDDELWCRVRRQLMRPILREKFLQNDGLRRQLLATGSLVLAEAAPRDANWGVGLALDDRRIADPSNWLGTNLLGWTLMEVRADLRGWARELAGRAQSTDGAALDSNLADMTLQELSHLPEVRYAVMAYADICAGRTDQWRDGKEFLRDFGGTLRGLDDAMRTNMGGGLPAVGWHELLHELDLRVVAGTLG
jgi:ribA/ribD-fused uncharacterized protein